MELAMASGIVVIKYYGAQRRYCCYGWSCVWFLMIHFSHLWHTRISLFSSSLYYIQPTASTIVYASLIANFKPIPDVMPAVNNSFLYIKRPTHNNTSVNTAFVGYNDMAGFTVIPTAMSINNHTPIMNVTGQQQVKIIINITDGLKSRYKNTAEFSA